MSIYVDPLVQWPSGTWCHMCTDGSMDELHAFAIRIGMKRSWFQATKYPHYDLVASKRRLAVKHGAVEVSSKEAFKFCYKK